MNSFEDSQVQGKTNERFKEVAGAHDYYFLDLVLTYVIILQSLIQEAMKLHLSDPKFRFSNEGIQAMAEVVRLFALEAIWRMGNQASNEGLATVSLDHLEKILPQLVCSQTLETRW